MINNVMTFICGLIFGCGLTVSMMINANKVQNFLDVTGNWDPSLLFVMFGAVVTAWLGFQLIEKLQHPLLADTFCLPGKKKIDRPLMLGASIFGIGWGLAGYCPGPGFTALGLGIMDAVYFIIGMILSVFFYHAYYFILDKYKIYTSS